MAMDVAILDTSPSGGGGPCPPRVQTRRADERGEMHAQALDGPPPHPGQVHNKAFRQQHL
jgi:hypothetical protein